MKIITFTGYEFDPKKLLNKPACPESLRAKMVKAILSVCPDDVEVKEFTNTTAIQRNSKKVNISAWQFPLSDWPNGRPFNYFLKDGSDMVLVWGVQFFDNGQYKSDISDAANQRCALGYSIAEENRALFMCGTKAMLWARQFASSAKEFLSDTDDLAKAIADHMPSNAVIHTTNLGMDALFKFKDYDIGVRYSHGVMRATIIHQYTETEFVYGDQFSDYSVSVKFKSVEEVDAYDWKGLWDNLYENRYGTLTHHGSLGT